MNLSRQCWKESLMNNGEYEYAQTIKDIETEILALKTAHQRPLGTLNFFQKSATLSISITAGSYGREFNVIVKISSPSVKPPITQVGWEIPAGFYDVSVINMTANANYDTWTYRLFLNNDGSAQTVSFRVGVISSQPIISISRSYV